VGYIGRTIAASETYPNFNKNASIMQVLLLLLGPTLFAASIYMILGRVVVLLDAESHSLVRPKWLTKFFVLGDVLSFLAQGAGSTLFRSLPFSSIISPIRKPGRFSCFHNC
jgi:hypothetical protein